MSASELSEREKLLKNPKANVMGEIFRLSTYRVPNRPALIFEGREFTYRELDARINRVANALLGLGVRKGDQIGIFGHNSNVWLECYLGQARAGCSGLPINFRLVGHEVEYILNFGEAAVLFIDQPLLEVIKDVRSKLKVKQIVVMRGPAPDGMITYDDFLKDASDEPPDVDVQESDLSFMAQTSGTTGRPKFVMHTHRSGGEIIRNVAFAHDYREDDIDLMVLPAYSSAAFGYDFCPTFWHGGTVIVAPLPPFDPVAVLELVDKYKVNRMTMAPVMLDAILFLVPEEVKAKYDISSLRNVLSVGAPTEMHTREAAIKYFGEVLYVNYSASELGLATVLKPHEVLAHPKSSGRCAVGMEIKIMDDEYNELPPGEIGEIMGGGVMVCQGYFKDPEATKAATHGRFMGLGDMGYVDEEGYLYVVDRKSDMIVSGGMNIYPAEIEAVMIGHPKIAEVAVIGVPDEKWGQSVKAVIVPAPGEEITEEEIIEWCRGKMAGYRLPRSVDFVSEFPKTPTGKIKKKILRDTYWKDQDRKI